MVVELFTGSGVGFIVDDVDAAWASLHSWRVDKTGGYIVRDVGGGKRRKVHRLHREVIGAASHDRVSHKNGDPRDNRRDNIFVCGAKSADRMEIQEEPCPGARAIQLTRGLVAWVDADDYPAIAAFKWIATTPNAGRQGYAVRYEVRKGRRRVIWMHREIARPPADLHVDHINGNGLDNRRCNLRHATPSENSANATRPPSLAGYRGVRAPTERSRWRAQIRVRGDLIELGSFSTAIEAARAYDAAAINYRGEFAVLNFPTHHRIPSVAGRTMPGATMGRTGNVSRKIP